jgi:hypothetical protein
MPGDKIIRSKRKTLYLEIAGDGTLIVRAPLRCSEAFIRQAVEKHRDWINRRQKYVREHPPTTATKQYRPGGRFLYLGKTYPLSEAASGEAPLFFDGQQFLLGKNRFAEAPELFYLWYKQAALKILPERVALAAALAGIHCRKISVTRARRRWGSCGAQGNVNFACRLMMAPLEVIDAVVMHELVHVKVRNHSKRFWVKLMDLVPEYKKSHQWLKDNQHLLSF